MNLNAGPDFAFNTVRMGEVNCAATGGQSLDWTIQQAQHMINMAVMGKVIEAKLAPVTKIMMALENKELDYRVVSEAVKRSMTAVNAVIRDGRDKAKADWDAKHPE